ncbi:MAG: amidase [Alkalilacustris sp.]
MQAERIHPMPSFAASRAEFLAGRDRPSAYLERCLAQIEAREPTVRAFVHMAIDTARAVAAEADARYAAGTPLSAVDGMPIGVKDLYETKDMPTGMGSPIYEGWMSNRDAAAVAHLRAAGAIILGKTVTTEFGFYTPGPTTNPFDPERTPGGSSSGSAAAVGAGMVPATIGSQVVGSIIRPAGFCGNVAFKPTYGALCRSGGHSSLSQSHMGTHAGHLEDAWALAWEISARAGGDPGHPGLYGPAALPAARPPARLARIDTEGMPDLDAESRAAFEALCVRLQAAGVEIVTAEADPALAAFEAAIGEALALTHVICGWELRWPLSEYARTHPGQLSADLAARLDGWMAFDREEYRAAIARRDEIRGRLDALRRRVDGLITLSSIGPAPKGLGSTGKPGFNPPASMTGGPTFSLPLMQSGGLPLGLQLIGFVDGDADTAGIARWMMEALG